MKEDRTIQKLSEDIYTMLETITTAANNTYMHTYNTSVKNRTNTHTDIPLSLSSLLIIAIVSHPH
jgi:hypothetical protein